MSYDYKKNRPGKKPLLEVTPEIVKEIEILANRGLKQIHIANYYGLSKGTWQRVKKRHPELVQACVKGKSHGISFASKKLMELIKAGNLEAIKYYLSRIGKYTEELEDDENDEEVLKPKKLEITVTDPIEAAKIYQQFMQGSSKK